MFLELFIKYIHFICIFTIVGALSAEHLLLKPKMSRQEISRMAKIDAVYGMSALVLLIAGLSLWFWVGKPASFYSHNWIFYTKLIVFATIGILSIYPTIFFTKQRKGNPDEEIEVPRKIKMLIRTELLLLFIIPILASMMARGVGYFG